MNYELILICLQFHPKNLCMQTNWNRTWKKYSCMQMLRGNTQELGKIFQTFIVITNIQTHECVRYL